MHTEPPVIEDRALIWLLRLASPSLPVGAYSYSQGLEWAVEERRVRDAESAARWIGDVLAHSMECFEAPIWWRLYRAWSAVDLSCALQWNARFLAARETKELRAETVQMGYSLLEWLAHLEEVSASSLGRIRGFSEPTFPAVFSFAAVEFGVSARSGLTGYLWSWLENQVLAAMKLVPLGQVAGQQVLSEVARGIPPTLDRAFAISDEDLSNFAPALTIASSRHEVQYTRLFRS